MEVEGTSSPQTSHSEAEIECTQFLAEAQIDRSADPLTWWQQNQHRFPLLATLAKKYLCICATSVPSERLFSSAGLVVNKRRASLNPDTVDMILFLKKIMV